MVDEDGKQVMTDKEIFDNIKLIMVIGRDTSFILITFIIWLLAKEPFIFAVVLQGMHQQSVCVNKRKKSKFCLSYYSTYSLQRYHYWVNSSFICIN